MCLSAHIKGDYRSGSCQLIGFSPIFSKNAFTFENGRLPKKPLLAENGLGCVDSTMK